MDLQKVVKLTASQYAVLASGGTIGSYTGLNSSYLYMVEDSAPYIPLAGTSSLYGSIIPLHSSVNLGRDSVRFQSIYAGFMSVSSIWTQGISWPGTIYITANTQIVGGGGGGNLYLNAGSYVSTTASSIYTKAYKDVSIYASSSIFIGASKNLELRADGGIAFLYGSQAVKIVAGESMGGISQNATPAISMWLSGGYFPIIEMYANYSGYGGIDLYTTAGNARVNYKPIMTGYVHNIRTKCNYSFSSGLTYDFIIQLVTSTSAIINTGDKLWNALKSAGYYSTTYTTAEGCMPWSYACPVIGITQYAGWGTVAGVGAYSGGGSKRFLPHMLNLGYVHYDAAWNLISYFTVSDKVMTIQW